VTTEDWTITRVLAASWLGNEIDALVGGKETVIASSCAARSAAASCSTVGAVGNTPAHAFLKKELKTSNKLGILVLDDPLCAVFDNGGEDLISGASVPEPVTGWMKFVGNGEKEELAPETA
jgi:hypothetical protein